jgi:hypothetical protein
MFQDIDGFVGSDQIAWTSQTITSGDYESVAYGVGKYIAVKGAPQVASSSDGISWSNVAVNSALYKNIIYEGSKFLAVSASLSNQGAAVSADGITWSYGDILFISNFLGAAYNQSIYVVVGGSDILPVAFCSTSPDGITWTARTIPSGASAGDYKAITYGNEFVAVGGNTTFGSICATSPDGITWTARTIPGADWRGIKYFQGLYVAVGVGSICATSPDGITWTSRTIPTGGYYDLVSNGSIITAVGDNIAATSVDGINWNTTSITSGNYRGVAFGNEFMAVGESSAASLGVIT